MECSRDGFPRKKCCFFFILSKCGGGGPFLALLNTSAHSSAKSICSIAPVKMDKLFAEFRLVKDTATEVLCTQGIISSIPQF